MLRRKFIWLLILLIPVGGFIHYRQTTLAEPILAIIAHNSATDTHGILTVTDYRATTPEYSFLFNSSATDFRAVSITADGRILYNLRYTATTYDTHPDLYVGGSIHTPKEMRSMGRLGYLHDITAWNFLRWSPDGRLFAYITRNGVKLCLVEIAQQKNCSEPGAGTYLEASNFSSIIGLSWSPDSQQLAVLAQDKVYIYNQDGKLVHEYAMSNYGLSNADAIAWSPNGEVIAVTGRVQPFGRNSTLQNAIRFVSVLPGVRSFDYPQHTFGNATDILRGSAWSSDGTSILLASASRVLRYNLRSGSTTTLLTGSFYPATLSTLPNPPRLFYFTPQQREQITTYAIVAGLIGASVFFVWAVSSSMSKMTADQRRATGTAAVGCLAILGVIAAALAASSYEQDKQEKEKAKANADAAAKARAKAQAEALKRTQQQNNTLKGNQPYYSQDEQQRRQAQWDAERERQRQEDIRRENIRFEDHLKND